MTTIVIRYCPRCIGGRVFSDELYEEDYCLQCGWRENPPAYLPLTGRGQSKIHIEQPKKGRPEGPTYARYDSGCEQATRFLGNRSMCLTCEFPACAMEEPEAFRNWIRKRERK